MDIVAKVNGVSETLKDNLQKIALNTAGVVTGSVMLLAAGYGFISSDDQILCDMGKLDAEQCASLGIVQSASSSFIEATDVTDYSDGSQIEAIILADEAIEYSETQWRELEATGDVSATLGQILVCRESEGAWKFFDESGEEFKGALSVEFTNSKIEGFGKTVGTCVAAHENEQGEVSVFRAPALNNN